MNPLKHAISAVIAAALSFNCTNTFAAQTAASAGGSTATQGEGKASAHEALERFKAALKQLDLSDKQKESIKSIVEQAHSRLEAMKGDKEPQGTRREIIEQARKEIVAQLTQPQKTKLHEILKADKAQANG
jgi:Spy/CpxP family protein refolding chaperone